MATTAGGDKTVSRVALCSAIFAGFAYVGYSVVRNAICRRGRELRSEDDDDDGPCSFHTIRRLSVASQTDFLLGNLDISNGGLVRPLSVRERIRELNLQARHFGGEEGIIMRFSPFYKPRSLQCSPWSSPRILSPVDINQFISRSAENLTSLSPPSSPILRRKSTSKRRSPSRPRSSNAAQDGATTHQVTEVHILLKDSEETLRKRLDGLYNKGRVITPYEAQSLVALLYTRDEGLLLRTLTTITNCAAFSVNQNYLRETGCLSMLCNLLTNPSSSRQVRTAVIQAIGNLSLNQENLKELRCCLTPLMANLDPNNCIGGEELLLPSLITLTNLAVLPNWHVKYIKVLHILSALLDRGPEAIQMQVCKLLVNLSCNADMVPQLLAAQAPSSLMEMLTSTREEEFLLRITTVLDNVTSTVRQHSLEPSDLPAEEKAPSPETLYAAIYGLHVADKMRNRVFVLTKHTNEEIKSHAKRIYECLKGVQSQPEGVCQVEARSVPEGPRKGPPRSPRRAAGNCADVLPEVRLDEVS